ncbi:unnamed protein product [Alopecurus aequalis]
MRAVVISSPGGPEALEEREVEDLPAPGDGEVLLGVAAAGVNRTDTRNLNSLAVDGRLFIVGFMGGTETGVNLQPMFARRLTIQVAGLRNRGLANKAQIVSEVGKHVWPAVVSGKVKPVIYKTLPLSEADEAHKLMESSSHIGKILLIP